jgi:hypothetical protein
VGEELVAVVVESTYNWYWLVDGQQEAGFAVKLANTSAIKKYDGHRQVPGVCIILSLSSHAQLSCLP